LIGLVVALFGLILFLRFGQRSVSAREREQLLEELRTSLNGKQATAGRAHS
jgi:hypothetical protein